MASSQGGGLENTIGNLFARDTDAAPGPDRVPDRDVDNIKP